MWPASSGASINKSELPPLVHPKDLTTSNRIVGGEIAGWGQFPYQCLLRVYGGFTCGCSILSDRWILTAAHCVGQDASAYTVLVGTINANGEGGAVYQAERVISHENYGNFMNDIAMILVNTNIRIEGATQIIIRAGNLPGTGSTHVLSGWGRVNPGGDVSQVLKFVYSNIIDGGECAARTGINHPGTICFFSSNNNGVCNGDSGGPAQIQGLLVGVTNFIVGQCGGGFPDGYASVPYYNDWINRVSFLHEVEIEPVSFIG